VDGNVPVSTSSQDDFLEEVVFPPTSCVRVTCEDDYFSIKIGFEISIDLDDLPEYLKDTLLSIKRTMMRRGFRKVEILSDPRSDILVDGRECCNHGLGSKDRLHTFAFLLSELIVKRDRLETHRRKLAALGDRRRNAQDYISELQSKIFQAQERIAEFDRLSAEVSRVIETLVESLVEEPGDHRKRDRDSARLPRGRHRKSRVSAK